MKIEVESEALDSLKAMAQRLQEERDELLAVLSLSEFLISGVGSIGKESHAHMRIKEAIAKCAAKPEVLE